MVNSKVTEIEVRDDGSIRLTVEVFGFEAAGTPVEISGNATQANGPNGAIATFYHVQNLPPANSDGGSRLTVIAEPPSTEFVIGDVITVVGRAAKVWSTVLDGDPDEPVWKARPEPPSDP